MRSKSKIQSPDIKPKTDGEIGLPRRPDDPKKPGGGYAEETVVTTAKTPAANNTHATAEVPKTPPQAPSPIAARSSISPSNTRRRGRLGR